MRSCILFFFILLCFLNTFAQTENEKSLSQEIVLKIDSLFSAFDKNDNPGYAIGISKGQETIYSNAFGSANLDFQIPLNTSSAFSIASVSKQFTGACIALLIMDGKLSLDDEASKFVPALEKFGNTILIKHLLYNTSGITDYHRLARPSGKSWHTFNYFEIDECIETSLAQDTLMFTPGSQWDYCNVNFMLLTKVVEKVSGLSFREFADMNIFQPLNMTNTLVNDDATEVIPNRVTPYNTRQEDYIKGYEEYGVTIRNKGSYIQHPRVSPHYGGSGVVTTIEDLLKWSKNMHSLEIGGQAFYDIMHATLEFQHNRKNQAMGLYHGNFQGHKIVAWDGGDWGISSQLMRFPEQGVAIVVLSNLGSGEAFRKANGIAQILIDEEIIQ